MLAQHGYQIVLVSPLPESSREPLRVWFADQGIQIASPAIAVLGLDLLALCSKAMRGDLHDWYFNFYERDLDFPTGCATSCTSPGNWLRTCLH